MHALAQDQLRNLLAIARKHSQRDWLMILLAFGHGLRASELVNLTVRDVEDGYLVARRLKGSMTTTQPVFSASDPLLDEQAGVTAWTEHLSANDRLFPMTRRNAYKIVNKYARMAGLPKHLRNTKMLKHTTATTMIDGGAQINEVQRYLGHKSMSSTAQYMVASDEKAARAFAMATRLGGNKSDA